ncbi:MAG: hypothetical protein ACI89L_001345 [Phycisphaerales bacterium]|jgi:hypothetical protein
MRSIIFTLLAVLSLAPAARGQGDEISVDARLSQQQAYVGEILEYQIVVQNAKPDEVPEIVWPRGVKATFSGSNSINQQYSSLDPSTGRMTLKARNTTLLTYRLVTTETGRYTIDGTTLSIGGDTYDVNPVTFTVLDAPEADDFDVIVQLDRTRVFVGETLRLRVHWYLSASVSEYSFRPSTKPDSFEAVGDDATTQLSRREQLYPIDVFGIRTVARLRDATYNGERMRVLYFELLVRPTEAGVFEMGPIGVLFDRRTARGSNARTISKSDPIIITVEAPPTEGQPEGYNGLIGQFGIEASAAPTRANVGEPIDLTVRIRGDEPMTGVRTGPSLAAIGGFTDDFRLSPDGWKRQPASPGERVFTTKIRALTGAVEEIPPIRLPYFDPVSAEYATAATHAIPLDIESVRTTTLEDAIGGEVPSAGAPGIERSGPIFWAEDRGASLLRRDPVSPISIVSSPVWASLAAVPPATYAVAFVVGAWTRSRNPTLAHTLAGLRAAQRLAAQSDHAHAAHKVLQVTLGIDDDAVTSADAMRLPIAIEHRESLAAAVLALEADYVGRSHGANAPPPPPSPPVTDAIAALREAAKRGEL